MNEVTKIMKQHYLPSIERTDEEIIISDSNGIPVQYLQDVLDNVILESGGRPYPYCFHMEMFVEKDGSIEQFDYDRDTDNPIFGLGSFCMKNWDALQLEGSVEVLHAYITELVIVKEL